MFNYQECCLSTGKNIFYVIIISVLSLSVSLSNLQLETIFKKNFFLDFVSNLENDRFPEPKCNYEKYNMELK